MPSIIVFTLTCFVFLKCCVNCSILGLDEDTFKTVPQLITKYGYESETHLVTTDDGYILTMFRMKSKDKAETKKEPILLVHGLLGSSADFLISGHEKALGYALADNGFDVWLLNSRGTRYSMGHTSIPTWNSTFWDFSWHELGVYDLPSSIDYILKVTKSEQIIHLGMSQGTTSFYVMLSERPEYNKLVKAHIGYAPTAFLCHMTNSVLRPGSLPESSGTYSSLAEEIGNFNILPHMLHLPMVTRLLCETDHQLSPLCSAGMEITFNFDIKRLELVDLYKFLGHVSAGASTKLIIHYAQLVTNCGFRHYQTGTEVPQSYNLSNIKVPIYAFYGEEDTIQYKEDTLAFENALENSDKHFILVKGFGHVDMMISPDARAHIYEPTIDIIKKLV